LSELGVGSSAMLELGLRGAYDARIRPGATFAIDLAVSPEGIVAIEPARVTIAPGQNTASFQIRALVPGTALVRISAPPDVVIVGAPLTLRVRP
jgi:hypothetical protein